MAVERGPTQDRLADSRPAVTGTADEYGHAAPAPVRVLVAGATGRLGSLCVEALAAAPGFELVGTLQRGDDADACLRPGAADVFLDVSLAAACRVHAPQAARRGIAPVVGTSGLTEADIAALRVACEAGDVGGLVVPNFSLGAVLQMRAAEVIARRMACAGIQEVHHPAKRDAPSGTARETAARIQRGAAEGRSPSTSVDRCEEPPEIQSERQAGVLARQIVVFEGGGERLVLEHEVSDRRAYLPGILLALRGVTGLSGLHTGLDVLLAGPEPGLL